MKTDTTNQMKTNSQNTNKKSCKCLLNVRIVWKILSLAISTMEFVVVLAWLSFHVFLLIDSTVASVVGYVDAKIKQEQTVYYSDAREILLEIYDHIG